MSNRTDETSRKISNRLIVIRNAIADFWGGTSNHGLVEDLSEDVLSRKSNPRRIKSLRKQVQRKERLVREMKRLCNNTCQLCDVWRLQGDDIGYSCVHYIKPLAKEHSGPDIAENVIVPCPNHLDDFDNGMLTVDPNTLEISHDYEESLTGRTVTLKRGHEIDSKFFAYHNQTITTK